MNRVGFKPLLVAGFTLIAAALLWFAQIQVGNGYVTDLLGPTVIAGAGLGITLVSVVTATTHDLRGQGESGLGSGLVGASQQMGGALGIAVLSTIATARTDATLADAPATPAGIIPAALTEGYQSVFYTGAGLAAAGIVVAFLVTTSPEQAKVDDEQ